jgi:multidrug efflux pump subunit AcrB
MSGPAPDPARGPIKWMAHNSVAANLLMMLFLVGGLVSFTVITKEVFPDIQVDVVNVNAAYPGSSPEEIEQGIVLAIEEALTGLVGIEELTSVASEARARIRAELIEGVAAVQVYQDIKSEVDRIITFPEDMEEPEVSLYVHRHGVMENAIYGAVEDHVLKALAERVRDQLLQDELITQVDITGTRNPEITIEVSQESLRRHGLTIDDLTAILRRAAVEIPGGGLKTESGEVLVRMTERRDYGVEFARLPVIVGRDGSQVLFEDIADITDGLEEVNRFATFNGKPAVMVEVYRVGGQTPLEVAEATLSRLAEIEETLPEGIEMAVRRNRSDIYRQRAELLLKNGMMGLTLVLLLLGIFLEMRLAFWVMMGIPISFLGSLILMPATGLTINIITMFAYILALGIVVDDAIVVGENVYRHYQEGEPLLEAAVAGAREMAMPVSFSILTNIAAFIPIYLLSGRMGLVMAMLPVVVICVFIISWVESIFILPAHLGLHRERKLSGFRAWLHDKQNGFSNGFRQWVDDRYVPFLSFCLNNRYLVVSVAGFLLAVTIGYMASGRMGFETFPRVESDYAYVTAALPYGAPIERSAEVGRRMTESALKVAEDSGHPELVTGVFARIGLSGTHDLECRAYLADPDVRSKIMGTQEFVERWRAELGRIKGAEYVRFQSDRGGPGSGSALTVELSHSRVETLEKAAVELAGALEAFPIVTDIDDGFQLGKEQLSFRIKPEGQSLGLTASEVARQVRNAYEGVKVIRQQRGRSELTVRVRLPESERISEGNLDDLILRTPAGGETPLKEVVTIERGRAYTVITHRNGRRTMTVTADVRPRAAAGRIIEALESEALPRLMSRYPGLTYSYQGRQAEQRKSIGSLWKTIPVVLAAIYALLAVPFRSYVQPLIVMISIPFGIVGAAAGHLLMGYSMSMMGVIGIVALSGVVVNNSLVFVDFVNRRRREGIAVRQALLITGATRFRPILLTTLTTFGGLAPMIFETSRQARFLIPMALSLGYGLVFATAITLLLVPSLYAIVEDVKGVVKREGE